MVVVEGERLFDAARARHSFDLVGVLFHFFARVQVVVSLPALLGVPPRFCIASMRSEVTDVAHGFEALPDRVVKLRLVDQRLTGPVFLQQPPRLGLIFAPALVAQLDHLRVVVEPFQRALDLIQVFVRPFERGGVLQQQGTELPGFGKRQNALAELVKIFLRWRLPVLRFLAEDFLRVRELLPQLQRKTKIIGRFTGPRFGNLRRRRSVKSLVDLAGAKICE